MAVSEHWQYQGRQHHQWFGHGTAPKDGKGQAPTKPGSLFDPFSVGQRVDYATGSVVAHSPRNQRSRWDVRVGGTNQDSLKTAVAVWYGASKLSRDTFRQLLLDPNTSDETVDRLRNAAKGIVNARTHEQLGAAGEDLAAAAQTIGPDRWSRFIGDAERRGVAAASQGSIPGVVKASAAGTDTAVGVIALGLILLTLGLQNQGAGSARPTISPTTPSSVPVEKPTDDKLGSTPTASPATPEKTSHDELAQPGDATLAEDRRKYLLDGNGRGGGGHGPGRTTPDKSTFPSDWSDEKTIEAIKDVANDPASVRTPADGDRTSVDGTRDGVDIRVIIGRDGKAIVTAYPTNITPRGE